MATQQRPFLKWAGGKLRILSHISTLLPQGKRLIEPFVGSGAVFLNCHYPNYLLSDINPDLITLYRTLQNHHSELLALTKTFFTAEYNTETEYYRLRTHFNRGTDPLERSALFIYLNRHGYNGLCRYNLKGEFNVPFGRYRQPYFPQQELQYFHQHSQRVQFSCEDFAQILAQAQPGDVFYCDPPYVPLSKTAAFTTYHGLGFGLEAQQRLAQAIHRALECGATVLLSNHDTDLTRQLYEGATIKSFPVRRAISCKGRQRRPAQELLALFEPHG